MYSSKNINERLLEEVARDLGKYDCSEAEIERVLLDRVSFDERRERAASFIQDVLAKHGKEVVWRYVAHLAEVEQGIRLLQPWQRDHVVHAVRTFLVGIFLNERFLSSRTGELQCKLALLLHDVGYPLQIASEVGRPFGNKLNQLAAEIGVSIEPVRFVAPQLEGLDQLTKGNSLDLIQDQLKRWGIDLDVVRAYEQNTNQETVCHGVVSALAVLRVVDLLYARNNPLREHRKIIHFLENRYPVDGVDWDQTGFEDDNLPACAAVFLHNLKNEWFAATKIRRELAPVAFLLKVADTLQEWERPSGENPDGLSPFSFEIDVTPDGLVFRADMSAERKSQLRQDIEVALDARDIIIE